MADREVVSRDEEYAVRVVGLLLTAVATGLVFARFALLRARLTFSARW